MFSCQVSGSVYVPDPSPMCSDYIYGLYHHYDDIFARQQLPYRAKYSSYSPCYHGYFPEVKVDVNGFIQGQFKFTSPFTCAQESVYANLGNVGPIFFDSFVLSLEALKFRSDLCFYLPFLYKGSTWLFWKPTEYVRSFSPSLSLPFLVDLLIHYFSSIHF